MEEKRSHPSSDMEVALYRGQNIFAMEMEREITLKYQYTDTFLPSDEVRQKSKEWYEDGVQVIFACNGGASVSVMQTAEELDGKVIGVDADQSAVSPTVLTSAGKKLKRSCDRSAGYTL